MFGEGKSILTQCKEGMFGFQQNEHPAQQVLVEHIVLDVV